jgi:hypothetical protein
VTVDPNPSPILKKETCPPIASINF